eukprot:NODE_3218_length_814_cov_0.940711.p1 GENE.NODE_3218_length_814_cov_0.940711~~NODE_3218_length_814_cov_0.940711.p1  ORF type:complete len:134 (-),score=24.05 NODE_3218_length_814_cov_0.940711:121-522(-)
MKMKPAEVDKHKLMQGKGAPEEVKCALVEKHEQSYTREVEQQEVQGAAEEDAEITHSEKLQLARCMRDSLRDDAEGVRYEYQKRNNPFKEQVLCYMMYEGVKESKSAKVEEAHTRDTFSAALYAAALCSRSKH